VHIAGGSELGGMHADSHSGAPLEPVQELLNGAVRAKLPMTARAAAG
jgi:uncharacterized protein